MRESALEGVQTIRRVLLGRLEAFAENLHPADDATVVILKRVA